MAKVRHQFDTAGPLIGTDWPLEYRGDDEELVATLRDLGVRRFSSLSYAHRPHAICLQCGPKHVEHLTAAFDLHVLRRRNAFFFGDLVHHLGDLFRSAAAGIFAHVIAKVLEQFNVRPARNG